MKDIQSFDKSIIEWQKMKIQNQEEEILTLKNTIKDIQSYIDKMKHCVNCKYNYPGIGDDFDEICERCENYSEWVLFNE